MTVLKFRVVLDTKNDVFRDVEILAEQSLEEFHEAVVNAFGFSGDQMASFFISDDKWTKGEEISLMDMGGVATEQEEEESGPKTMRELILDDVIEESDQKLIYVYDFMRMWCFFIELVEESKPKDDIDYPRVVMKFGEAPDEESKEIPTLLPDDMDEDDEGGSGGIGEEIDNMFEDFDDFEGYSEN